MSGSLTLRDLDLEGTVLRAKTKLIGDPEDVSELLSSMMKASTAAAAAKHIWNP